MADIKVKISELPLVNRPFPADLYTIGSKTGTNERVRVRLNDTAAEGQKQTANQVIGLADGATRTE